MTDDQKTLNQITHEVMSDKTSVPLEVRPEIAWLLAQTLRVSARHPDRTPWGKKAYVALAKKLEKIVKARHPIPDVYKPVDLLPIIFDEQTLAIDLSMQEAFEIVTGVQLVRLHPDVSERILLLSTAAAISIQQRIIEHHPDSEMLLNTGWNL